MKNLLKSEEAAQLVLGVFFLYLQPISLPAWGWPLVFLAPDFGMLGYLVSPVAGAFTYNLLHHKGIAITVALAGYFFHFPLLLLAGILLFAHSAFDRILGYGLKYTIGFSTTHLGIMGRKKSL